MFLRSKSGSLDLLQSLGHFHVPTRQAGYPPGNICIDTASYTRLDTLRSLLTSEFNSCISNVSLRRFEANRKGGSRQDSVAPIVEYKFANDFMIILGK